MLDKLKVIIKYNSAINVHISKERNVVATRFFPIKVKSITEMVETSDESFINIINWDAIGGSTALIA